MGGENRGEGKMRRERRGAGGRNSAGVGLHGRADAPATT